MRSSRLAARVLESMLVGNWPCWPGGRFKMYEKGAPLYAAYVSFKTVFSVTYARLDVPDMRSEF